MAPGTPGPGGARGQGQARGTRGEATPAEEAALVEAIRRQASVGAPVSGPLVSIVMLNRNGADLLRQCLPSLGRTAYRDVELIVVDNGSTDDSMAILEAFAPGFPVRIVRNESNPTFSEANNQALPLCRGELVLLLNNDIEPIDPSWLGAMVQTISRSGVVAVGARLVYPRAALGEGTWRSPALSLQHGGVAFRMTDGLPLPVPAGVGQDAASAWAAEVRDSPALTAACLLVRRPALDAVGGLPAGYVYGLEDVDLCLALRALGGRLVYDGRAALWHHESATRGGEPRDVRRDRVEANRRLFAARWAPRLARTALLAALDGDRAWLPDGISVGVGDGGGPGPSAPLREAFGALGWREVPSGGDTPDVAVIVGPAADAETLRDPAVRIGWIGGSGGTPAGVRWLDDVDVVVSPGGGPGAELATARPVVGLGAGEDLAGALHAAAVMAARMARVAVVPTGGADGRLAALRDAAVSDARVSFRTGRPDERDDVLIHLAGMPATPRRPGQVSVVWGTAGGAAVAEGFDVVVPDSSTPGAGPVLDAALASLAGRGTVVEPAGPDHGAVRIRFVEEPAEAGAASTGELTVVLDPRWTPGPAERPGVVPIRALAAPVLEGTDLFTTSLERLDEWAAAAGVGEALADPGGSWWYRLRIDVVQRLHEWTVWLGVLRGLSHEGQTAEFLVPATQPELAAVARLVGSVSVREGSGEATAPAGAATRPPAARPPAAAARRTLLARIVRLVRRVGPGSRPAPRPTSSPVHERVEQLGQRASRLATGDSRILAVTQPAIFQAVAGATGERRVEPQLQPVLDRLADLGWDTIEAGLGVDHRTDAGWATVEANATMLPQSMLAARWTDPAAEAQLGSVHDRLATVRSAPLAIDGTDLAPLVLDELRARATFIDGQRRQTVRVGSMLREVRPRAILLNHEGIRTPWVAGGLALGIPVFAVQHGLIFPMHPVYRGVPGLGRALPTTTFVYGPYERDVLVEAGGYDPASVVVGGSPRLEADAGAGRAPAASAEDRTSLRRALGVADGDRLLVVSTASARLYRQFHLPHLVERVLGGPLPRVHVAFKLHPGEGDDGPYRALLEGLAHAGGYPAPPVSVVKDVDLFRLLRAADAHLGLHSTVLTDAVVAGTRNLVAAVEASGDFLGYVAAGVAVPVRSAQDVIRALEAPPAGDANRREAFLRRHFEPGDAAARIAAHVDATLRAGGSGS